MKKALRLVTKIDQAKRLADQFLSGPKQILGIDCEGVRLGRFGRLSLLQLSELNGTVSLLDARVEGLIEAFGPILESQEIVKIMHDSREDSSALLHQFNIRLRSVIDTQVAALLVQKRNRFRLHQESYEELVARFCRVEKSDTDSAEMKTKMLNEPFLWHQRPLSKQLVDYAVHGVEHLIPLWTAMSQELDLHLVLQSSEAWLAYRDLNRHLSEPNRVEKIGTPLQGMVAAVTDKGVFFKLNIGRTGVVSTPSALKRMLTGAGDFPPVQVGDTIDLCVSGISLDGKTVYVDRSDPDWEYFDFLRRPDPKKIDSPAQEYRHIPSLVEGDARIDPLLRRGLGSFGEIDSDSDDEVDHEPILTHKPPNR